MKIKKFNPVKSVRQKYLTLGVTLYLFTSNAWAALPTSSEDVLPDGVTADKPADALLGMASWGAQVMAYLLMIGAVVGGGYYVFKAFGEANDTKGGWGAFFGTLVATIIMIAVVVALGLIVVEWAGGLSDVTVGAGGG
ncbi:MAG: hypothetical protein L3J62_10070 [Gammaproteobacteria bacterium]|nr:hypothetical protein [Gammaproteobacteria bacterium]